MTPDRTRSRPWIALMACALVAAWSGAGLAGPGRADEPAPVDIPPVHVIELDGTTRRGPLGRTQHFDCAHAPGKRHAVTCRVLDPQTLEAPGCAFSYPAGARLQRTAGEGWTLYTLEFPGGALLQLEVRDGEPLDGAAVAAAVHDEAQAWIEAYRGAGLRSARTTAVTRRLAGPRSGLAIEGRFNGPSQFGEIYVIPHGSRTLVCTLEWDAELRAQARTQFDAFCKSFKVR